MTQIERLKELFKEIEYTPFPEMTAKANLANQFTDYAVNCIVDEMLKNGVIVPPCEVGDTVYYPSFYKTAIIEGEILRIVVDDKGIMLLTNYTAFDASEFGESVFFTREEAEKALAEREKDDESEGE